MVVLTVSPKDADIGMQLHVPVPRNDMEIRLTVARRPITFRDDTLNPAPIAVTAYGNQSGAHPGCRMPFRKRGRAATAHRSPCIDDLATRTGHRLATLALRGHAPKRDDRHGEPDGEVAPQHQQPVVAADQVGDAPAEHDHHQDDRDDVRRAVGRAHPMVCTTDRLRGVAAAHGATPATGGASRSSALTSSLQIRSTTETAATSGRASRMPTIPSSWAPTTTPSRMLMGETWSDLP